MQNYCSSDHPGSMQPTYVSLWQGDNTTSQCQAYADLNACNPAHYEPVVDAFVRRYLITEAHPITYAQQGSLVYDPAIETIVDTCQKYPGGCDTVLKQVCSTYTRADLATNPNLASLCGCFMSDFQYNSYGGAFGVKKICDPACTLQSAVKPLNTSNTCTTQSCDQAICVIDNVKIELLSNSTAGNINFAQACASCTGGAGCVCNISDISVTSVESKLGNINLSQQCGGNPNCFKSDANGVPQVVPCSTLDPSGGTVVAPSSKLSTTALLIIIAVVVLVVILIIIFLLLLGRRKEEPTILRNYQPIAGPPPGSYSYTGSSSGGAPLI